MSLKLSFKSFCGFFLHISPFGLTHMHIIRNHTSMVLQCVFLYNVIISSEK